MVKLQLLGIVEHDGAIRSALGTCHALHAMWQCNGHTWRFDQDTSTLWWWDNVDDMTRQVVTDYLTSQGQAVTAHKLIASKESYGAAHGVVNSQ